MSGTDKDLQCRELIAKAVCGKGHKFSTTTHTIIPSQTPSTILGCWIINTNFQAEKVGDAVEVSGTYDVNLWFSFANNTQTEVKRETVKFSVLVPLTFFDRNCRGDLEIVARAVEQPKCVKAELSGGGTITVKVESEFAVEIIGETKVCVVVCNSCEEKDLHMLGDFEDNSDEFDDFDSATMLDELD
ncbi:spore coat protein E [Brevibacillus reuszeri]|uniref:Spore coat protein n=1 Tax=Brevibacillus reuszeri TaxID=54915 RepID=A0A0K9YVW0_9BACL|nr:outer spore coat protein CotE [Brevibacillus reuszeri]KNB72828.1 spore coat protein [Brevibacillus reuszeri]MED1860463.1 outer spore coat protein CotE [Brevibacillus reuszeri]GED70132.1 spore coat protein E [Brevibacillus reuszeri]